MAQSEEQTINLAIRVVQENLSEVTDALNEVLNVLAREDVLNDDADDAWAWSGLEPIGEPAGEQPRRTQNDMLRGAYERGIDTIVADLRNLADRVERRKVVTPRGAYPHLNSVYLGQATSVLSDILNCLPNLNLGLLMERAHDCETLMEKET